ncbi:MAG TPA: RidA family protein [Vicinamibacterales bacterium]|nr:RidA family protein [Vicinamibacterales bacterium]
MVILLAVGVSSCASLGPPYPDFINLTDPSPYPFSSAVRSGPYLFLSGQIGTKTEDGKAVLVSGGIEAETKQTFENIKAILAKANSSLDRVIKCTVMMADMAEWPKMNEIYTTFFPGKKPARSAFGATGLALGARVEIECIALVK